MSKRKFSYGKSFATNMNNINENKEESLEASSEEELQELSEEGTSIIEENTETNSIEEVTTEYSDDDLLVEEKDVKKVLGEEEYEKIKKASEFVHSSLVTEKKELKVNMKNNVEATLLSYYEAVNNKKIISPEENARWNYSLFLLFKEIYSKPFDVFKKDWVTLLNFFDSCKEDCFRHELLFRAPSYWPGSETEYRIYRRLGFIAVETSDPKTRYNLFKRIDLNIGSYLEDLTEEQKNNFINFYSQA